MMKPGVPVTEVVETVGAKLAENCGDQLCGRIGHGMGMDYAERPGLNLGADEVLQAGMTAVMHTMTVVPDSQTLFVPLGDVVHVTPDGPEFLMNFTRSPFVAGR